MTTSMTTRTTAAQTAKAITLATKGTTTTATISAIAKVLRNRDGRIGDIDSNMERHPPEGPRPKPSSAQHTIFGGLIACCLLVVAICNSFHSDRAHRVEPEAG